MAATNCHARAHGRLVRRRTRAPANKPSAPPCLLSCGVFLSSTSIGRRRSILCGCGGSAAWANGSEVGERRGRQAGAGEDGGGRGQRDAGDLGFGDGSRSEGWVAALDPGEERHAVENFRTRDVQRTCVGPRLLRVGLQPADQNS
jgi:hypothetical protein